MTLLGRCDGDRHVSMDAVCSGAPINIFQVPWVLRPATTMWMPAGSKMPISSSGTALSREANGSQPTAPGPHHMPRDDAQNA